MKQENISFELVGIGLSMAAIILILVSIFSDAEPKWLLPAGLICCALSHLLGSIRSMLSKHK